MKKYTTMILALFLLVLMASGAFAAPAKLSTSKLTTTKIFPYSTVEMTPVVVPECNDAVDNDGDGNIDMGIDVSKKVLVPADSRTYDYAMYYNKLWYDISVIRVTNTSWTSMRINGEPSGWVRAGSSFPLSDGTQVTVNKIVLSRLAKVGLTLHYEADADAGCSSLRDNDETDQVYSCSDGVDNDADGLIDLADPGCESMTDDDEFNAPVLPSCMTPQYTIEVGQTMMEAYSHTFDADESGCLFGVESFSTPYGSTDDEKTLNLNVDDMLVHRSEYLREGFDDDVFGTYLYFRDGNKALRYLNIYYDDIVSSVDADGSLTDLSGIILPIGSSDYTVAEARYDSARDGVEMTLLKRATQVTIEEGVSTSVLHDSLDRTETVSVTNLIVSDATGVLSTNLNIDGEVTGALAEGETAVLRDGKVAYIRSITEGASDTVDLYIADYELFIPAWNGTRPFEANEETIEDANINIVGHASGGFYYLSSTIYDYYVDGVSGDEPYVAEHSCLSDYVDEPIGLWAIGVDICHGMVGADHTFFIAEKEVETI